MKSINKIIGTALIAGSMACATTSCDSFLKEYSQDLSKVTCWEDLDEVLLGAGYIKSTYMYVEDSELKSDRSTDFDILHVMTDEITRNPEVPYDNAGLYDMFAFSTWQKDTGVNDKFTYAGGDGGYWNDLYSHINVCNMVLAVIDEQPVVHDGDDKQIERVKGEAHFLRGLYYFMLANLYCEPYDPATAEEAKGVAFKLTEYVEDIEFEKKNLKDSYAQILEDLKYAEQFLEGKTRKSVYHADLNAARLLLSRVYLYMQDWQNAADYARKVIDAKPAVLDLRTVAKYENSVSATSPETIFSMGDYVVATAFENDGEDPAWRISDDMIRLYKDNDLRDGLYFGTNEDGIDNVFLKYNLSTDSRWGTARQDVGSVFLMRTPEAYLTLAEASAYLGDEGAAKAALEKYLPKRMSGDATVAESGNALVDFIRDERAREFLLEGHRWFDLRRYTVCQPYKWSKTIEHIYPYTDGWSYSYYDCYRLEEYDKAYTLPVPRSVVNYQLSLVGVERPDRKAYDTVD